jgi:hypothetical protein
MCVFKVEVEWLRPYEIFGSQKWRKFKLCIVGHDELQFSKQVPTFWRILTTKLLCDNLEDSSLVMINLRFQEFT